MDVGAGIGVTGVSSLEQDSNTRLKKTETKNNFIVKVKIFRL